MPRPHAILIVGIEPEAVDFSDPDLPPGMTAEKISGGLAEAQKQFAAQGDRADLCLVQPDSSADAAIAAQLARTAYDCVVVGGGIRVPKANVVLFETVINAIHRHAPHAAIAFNTSPEDSAAAAARVLSRDAN